MKRQGRWLPVLARWLLVAGLAGSAGCMCYLHPVEALKPELAEPCQSVPKCARDHVHIILVHGMDPLDYANLTGLRDWLQELGFHKTYYGQLYHTHYFNSLIHQVHQEDPEARFVLIGFSFGANMVRFLANWMKEDDIHLDLLVYLGGNTLKDNDYDQPPNCGRIVNILASGCIWNGVTMSNAENIHEPDVWHFGSPTHPDTLRTLARELAVVAASAPAVGPAPPQLHPPTALLAPDAPSAAPAPAAPGAEWAPPPRPGPTMLPQPEPEDGARGEWNFLKPVSRLHNPVEPADPPPPPSALPSGTGEP